MKHNNLKGSLILISAAFPALADNGKNFEPARQAAAIAVALTVALPIWNSISAACSAIKACSTFMLSFIPCNSDVYWKKTSRAEEEGYV